MQLLGHFLAPGHIPSPNVETYSDDSDAEEIYEYAALLRRPTSKDTQIGKYNIICAAVQIIGTVVCVV